MMAMTQKPLCVCGDVRRRAINPLAAWWHKQQDEVQGEEDTPLVNQ